MTFQLLGLSFHLYGLILGLAVSLGVLVADSLSKKQGIPEAVFWKVLLFTVVGGVVGARLYHVGTDWSFYQNSPQNIFRIWQGGLSIIGALIGGAIGITAGVLGVQKELQREKQMTDFSQLVFIFGDIGALSLPLSQAVGRIANFVNQELYGMPTELPWAIWIDPVHRSKGFEQFTRFHPLFAYEALGMLMCAVILWMMYRKKIWKIGQGNYLLFYGAWYGLFRSALEFLRIEKSYLWESSLGLNQVLLFIVGLVCMTILLRRLFSAKKFFQIIVISTLVSTVVFGMSGCQNVSQAALPASLSPEQQYQELLKKRDYSIQPVRFRNENTSKDTDIQVEVVNSREALTKGLGDREKVVADGMLLVFADKARHGIWMKDMNFDLDLIWVTNGQVVQITPSVKDPPGNNPGPIYYPEESVDMVLEVPAGMTTTWQLQVGDAFELR